MALVAVLQSFPPRPSEHRTADTCATCLHTGEAVDVCARRPGERGVQHERRPGGRRGAVVGHIGRQGDVTGRRRGGERARGRPVAHGADADRVRAGCGRIAGACRRLGKVSVLERHGCAASGGYFLVFAIVVLLAKTGKRHKPDRVETFSSP